MTLRRALRRFSHSALGDMLMAPRIGRLHIHPPVPVRIPRLRLPREPRGGWPDIAVVTPGFRHGEFLERTIRSVVGQGYPALRYAVMDGGSNDATPDILRHYAPRLDAWHSGPDGGQAAAVNAGFRRLPQTELMAWLNSDDLHLPGALHRVGAYFAAHPEVDVVYGHRILIDAQDREVGRWVLPPHDAASLTWADFIPQETMVWRRRIWDRVGGALDESFRSAMDWELILRFLEAGARFARLPHFLGCFRVHAEQKTQAINDIGEQESMRLREHWHPGQVTWPAINEGVRAYTLRHCVWHRARWLRDRLRRHETFDPGAPQDGLGPMLLPLPAPPAPVAKGMLGRIGHGWQQRARRGASARWQASATPAPGDIIPGDGSVTLAGNDWGRAVRDPFGFARLVSGPAGFRIAPQPAPCFRLLVEAGPPQEADAAADSLAVLDAEGHPLGAIALDIRRGTAIAIPLVPGQPATGVLQPMRDGRPAAAPCRVHRLTGAGDIVQPGSGIRLGAGWHDFEFFDGEWFRWSPGLAEIHLTPPAPGVALEILVEPGPGAHGQPFPLRLLDAAGATIASMPIARRDTVRFALDASGGREATVRLAFDPATLRPAPGDPRRLCFRVLRMRMA